MLHALQKQIQRVRDMITEYDEDEDRHMNPNPALHDFVKKLKVILKADIANNEITKKVGTNYFNTNPGGNNVLASLSSASQIDVRDSDNPHPEVIEALGNHVVLTEIFKFGSFRDLKNFRLINKQWKGIANSAIIQKRLWNLSINDKFGAYNSNRNEALSELNDCIEASEESFPLTSLEFSNLDDYNSWNSDALLRFYALTGQSIKRVKFSNFGHLTMNDFQDLLVNKMPNVDHISAGNIFFTNQEECDVPIVLPHLRTIEFIDLSDDEFEDPVYKDLPYYKDLLLAATNLKEILDFQIEHTHAVLDTGKMNCIKNLQCNMSLESCSTQYNIFSHSKPKLTSLGVTRGSFDPGNGEDFVFSIALGQSLARILVSSQDTLKNLQCMPYIFPVDFQLPKFPNLEFLNVFDVNDELDGAYTPNAHLPRVFPSAGCVCSEIFPNLHTILLDVRLNENVTLYNYFPGQVFPSVKNLEFQDSIQLGSAFKTIFPNVSDIKINNYEGIASRAKDHIQVFNRAFHLEIPEFDKQIESLEFHQCVLAHSWRALQFDALVTGVPPYICKKLLARHNRYKVRGGGNENIMPVEEILELLQTQNCLFRSLEGLRRLKIIFNHKDNVDFRISKNPDLDCEDGSENGSVELWNTVISPVSCIYGFSLMPNLEQVIIGYDHHLPNAPDIAQVLKPFSEFPYVKIVHEPTADDDDE